MFHSKGLGHIVGISRKLRALYLCANVDKSRREVLDDRHEPVRIEAALPEWAMDIKAQC